MSPDTLKLYHSIASPNSRRVRIFLAEKGLKKHIRVRDMNSQPLKIPGRDHPMYEAPYVAVSAIQEYLAFYPDRVDAIQIADADEASPGPHITDGSTL
jgi:hypothetical protein